MTKRQSVSDLHAAHDLARDNRTFQTSSQDAGCFCCVSIFPAQKVTKWCPDKIQGRWKDNVTALCPYCGVDSVIFDAQHVLSLPWLGDMEQQWFSLIGRRKEISDGKA